jgi:hemerythrin superfamily protein
VVDLLTEQHARIDNLFQRVLRAGGDDRHAAFGELARLLALHEIVEEEVVHPLTRRLDPDEHLADRMLDEESRISEALTDAVRADAAGDAGEVIRALRDMVRAHARHEERHEFSRLRQAVPAEELRQLTRAVRAAEEAAADGGAGAGPAGAEPAGGGPAGAGPRTLPQAIERVRDALRAEETRT